jgi:hypothetical protein
MTQNLNPFTPKPNAHEEAIAKLIAEYPNVGGRKLYRLYLDVCPAFISEETFEGYLVRLTPNV